MKAAQLVASQAPAGVVIGWAAHQAGDQLVCADLQGLNRLVELLYVLQGLLAVVCQVRVQVGGTGRSFLAGSFQRVVQLLGGLATAEFVAVEVEYEPVQIYAGEVVGDRFDRSSLLSDEQRPLALG
ncbi:hypothetical protein RNB18_16280 [Streptomyces sp. DSM 41640]|uniref:Uncharacterized protein n=1 Tax=Streptomyces doebereineriae TaxID=3075528 RepID=A0ABU2V838_9ACTN|nr:hypothetical protein [Streptomyces sp. DSM 41640]MDT0481732.1 hypothetical protein [Streptomyces sp. DSM 41640]